MYPDRDQVETQLARILSNHRFAGSPRMSELLVYLVRAELRGEAENIKGYSIGVDVFGRPADFDPSSDSIVRVQTGRLRRLLESYYLSDGVNDPVHLEIPKGQYRPVLHLRQSPPEPHLETPPETAKIKTDQATELPGGGRPALPDRFWFAVLAAVVLLAVTVSYSVFNPLPGRADNEAAGAVSDRISLAILPLKTSNDHGQAGFVAEGISSELVSTLTRIPALDISSPAAAASVDGDRDERLAAIGEALKADYVLEGNLQHVGSHYRVQIQLSNTRTEKTIWADVYDRNDEDVFDIQDEIVLALAAELRPQLVAAAKQAIALKPTARQSAWELYLRATWSPGSAVNSQAWEAERAELAERALEVKPGFGPAHSVLADKYAYLANLLPERDTPEQRASASFHAEQALDLSPQDPDALFNAGIHYWHMGNIEQSQEIMGRVLELDRSHPLARFLVYMSPYTCREVPEEAIARLAAYDESLSADNPVRWVTQAWLAQSYLNNGDNGAAIEHARAADRIFRTPETTYRLAAALVQAGEPDAAISMVEAQKRSWPDLDVHHYAVEAITRRCERSPTGEEITRIYYEMAETVEPPV
ncbi:hypothetical protein [Henriciella sp.]|uniref:hypothetical protein n=1 Tax=Henriciella sp. TaxID=1968823 RepID=UPI002638EFBA|nr:hypothetical protein [Henriciella sp.]